MGSLSWRPIEFAKKVKIEGFQSTLRVFFASKKMLGLSLLKKSHLRAEWGHQFLLLQRAQLREGSFVMSLDRFVKRAASWEEHWESRFCTDAALFLIYLWRTPSRSQNNFCSLSICWMLDTPSRWPLYLEIVTCPSSIGSSLSSCCSRSRENWDKLFCKPKGILVFV